MKIDNNVMNVLIVQDFLYVSKLPDSYKTNNSKPKIPLNRKNLNNHILLFFEKYKVTP